MIQRIGRGTLRFEHGPCVAGWAAVAGKKEAEGPMGGLFDKVIDDCRGGKDTYESAESELQAEAAQLAMSKCSLCAKDMDVAFAGDLLNQCVGASFGLMDFGIPFLGQYGACATMAQTLLTGAVFTEIGAAQHVLCVTSSHFCAAERQYRFPLEYGAVRTPTAQWTVTGAGSCVLCKDGEGIKIREATAGKIISLNVTDANNMGAAMAPAAAETIQRFFRDTNTSPQAFDCIFTGDLGAVGSELLYELLLAEGTDIRPKHRDCGLLIYDREQQDVHAGGSGCGCCATVLCAKILPDMRDGALHNVLFVATGALLSATTAQQGKTIPAVAHLIHFVS